ncbi:MAG: hydroxyacylglutathione hydrolase [Rhodospirillales bacterium]|nr:hydroxyacylglutathione hydrolase [Rhodospirillales bacterium]
MRVQSVLVFNDNYVHLLIDEATSEAVIVDPGEAESVGATLARLKLRAMAILITHHHPDHVEGVEALRQAHGLRVIGAKADAHRLPHLDQGVADGDTLDLLGQKIRVLAVPGHTANHLAYWLEDARILFPGDTLFGMGCGRLFEGTAAQMWDSLSRLKALPGETLVYCAHEYTAANGRFARTIEGANPRLDARLADTAALVAKRLPSVPFRLDLDCETNPFLRADRADVAQAVGLAGAPPAQVFAEIRARKDRFKG